MSDPLDELAASAFDGGRPIDPADAARAERELRARLLGVSGPATERYRLVRRVGAGGAGEVYEAWDDELKRRVALKVLHPRMEHGIGATQARARLVREAQAIAQLSHPNVVAVFDVGTCTPGMCDVLGVAAEGAVFVVMEYLEGPTLRAWLAHERPGWRTIVEVFVEAARGLAAAHAKGLVHRDFKPGNAIVADPHGSARVRVLDFGLARAIEPTDEASSQGDSTELDRLVLDDLTEQGVVMGTPPYMAPEQHRGEPADARTDQFAFAVALWEALHGERPFHGETMGELATAKHRGVELPRDGVVPRWLDRVLQRALAPGREDRWPAMADLVAALERGLARRTRVLASTAIAAVAIGGLATGFLARGGPTDERCAEDRIASLAADDVEVREAILASGNPRARDTWDRVGVGLAAYRTDLVAALGQACSTHDDRERAATLTCIDERSARLDAVTAVLAGADAGIVEHALELTAELPPVSTCTTTGAATPHVRPGDVERERSLLRAEALLSAGKLDEADAIARQVQADATTDQDFASLARADIVLGNVLLGWEGARPEQAEALFHDALVAAERSGDEAAAIEALTRLVHTVGAVAGRFAEADRFATQAEAKLQQLGSPGDLPALAAYELGLLRYREYRHDEALAAHRRALEQRIALYGEDHPSIAPVRTEIGNVQMKSGRPADARAEFERALAIVEHAWGPDHDAATSPLTGLALLDRDAGDHAAALAKLERVLAISRRVHGEVHDSVAVVLSNLALTLQDLGRHDEALGALDRALAIRTRVFGPDHAAVARTRTNRANCLQKLGKRTEAIAELRAAAATFRTAMGPEHPTVGMVLVNLGGALEAVGERDAAIGELERAVAILERAQGAERDALFNALATLGSLELAAGRPAAAGAHFERALAISPQAGQAAAVRKLLAQATTR